MSHTQLNEVHNRDDGAGNVLQQAQVIQLILSGAVIAQSCIPMVFLSSNILNVTLDVKKMNELAEVQGADPGNFGCGRFKKCIEFSVNRDWSDPQLSSDTLRTVGPFKFEHRSMAGIFGLRCPY